MKKTRKLIPAIAMLATSATMLATSSFAWFSMNKTVSATGMKITANAPSSLLISTKSATEGFGSTVTLSNKTTNMAPEIAPTAYAVSATESGKTPKPSAWYKLTNAAMKNVGENGVLSGAKADGSAQTDFSDENTYTSTTIDYFWTDVWLKYEGEAANTTVNVNATLSFAGNTSTSKIRNALHVLFVVGNYVVANVDMGGDDNESTTNDLVTAALTQLTTNGTATKVTIYYYLSGNDADCKNSNLPSNDSISVDISFGVMQDNA